MKTVHVVVEGLVQGVGYRYSLRSVAERAGVTGWTRNRADGTVEAVLEGEDAAVDGVVEWMAAGPPGADVTRSRVRETAAAGSTAFEIRPTA